MKSLYESILSSNGAGKYPLGGHIIEDGVSCNVVWNDKEKIILISDVYCGYQEGKPHFKENKDINKNNFAYHEWKRPTQSMNSQVPKGWSWPGYDELLVDENIRKRVANLLIEGDKNYSCVRHCWIKKDNSWGVYAGELDAFLRVASYDSGIRFMKIIKLSK